MGIRALTRAVFLDRDGVLNYNVLNPATGQIESPHQLSNFKIYPDVFGSLRRLHNAGYLLFVVSNQPSYAKGKTSLENIRKIALRLQTSMEEEMLPFARYYYCLHHPEAIIPEYSGPCQCRKPSPYFLQEAKKHFSVNLAQSWIIGDRESDIACGKAAGTQTILMNRPIEPDQEITATPDYISTNMNEAADIILKPA